VAGKVNRDFDDVVLKRMAEGESLRSICADLKASGCPVASWFCERALDEKEFGERYARARVLQCEAWADKIHDEAVVSRLGTKTVEKPEGVEITTGDAVDRSRLAVDALKWTLAKLHPAKYGDRLTQQLEGPDGGPIQLTWKSRSTTPPGTPQ
jgi:hypothetical protein